jgi:hypothetical protein
MSGLGALETTDRAPCKGTQRLLLLLLLLLLLMYTPSYPWASSGPVPPFRCRKRLMMEGHG